MGGQVGLVQLEKTTTKEPRDFDEGRSWCDNGLGVKIWRGPDSSSDGLGLFQPKNLLHFKVKLFKRVW